MATCCSVPAGIISIEPACSPHTLTHVHAAARNILVLCARYFQDLGYINTVMQIQSETGVSLNKIDVADNIGHHFCLLRAGCFSPLVPFFFVLVFEFACRHVEVLDASRIPASPSQKPGEGW